MTATAEKRAKWPWRITKTRRRVKRWSVNRRNVGHSDYAVLGLYPSRAAAIRAIAETQE